MNYNKWNNTLGSCCAILATVVYILTADQYNSWWDTGEFVASAYKLQVVHQPGAPLFLMIQNLFSNLALGDTARVAFWMNVGAAVCSGLTVLFLFWTITALAKKMFAKGDNSSRNSVVILMAGVIGSLAYAFTDTFWYSAVESEVYAMSSLCTAVVFWLILKWESRADEEGANRWLLVIAFVMGLSIGVHLLNLLTIPAIALFVYFKKVKKASWKGALQALLIGVFILAFILWGIIQYAVKAAAYTDLFFVNTLDLGFGTGILFFIICVVSLLVCGILYSIKRSKPILQLSLLAVCFVCFGFSSYAMLLIRSQTNISLNNGSPDNAFSFLGYLSREQYGSEPLWKGPIYTSKINGVEVSKSYRKDPDKYSPIEGAAKYSYDKEMLFPRIYSEKHAALYNHYLGLSTAENPGFVDNLKFFFTYQVNQMYLRYFLWNFVGRQDDIQGYGGDIHGNWLSGVKFVDNRLAGQEFLPDSSLADPSRNTYFFLPLLLGIVGLVWQVKKQRKDAVVTGLLFFFTGLAIVIYINQTPMQPRERDYAYAGSFYIFAIWIGLGVLGLVEMLRKIVHNSKLAIPVACGFAFLAAPVLLVSQNWDDHDRSDRYWTRDMAYNYLQSCEANAILFTYADNDTFPLWYLQEVEGIRTDVRIVNLSYLQSDWYFKQATMAINQAEAVPFNIPLERVQKGVRDVIYTHDMGVETFTDLDTLLKIMVSDDRNNQVQLANGKYVNVLPTKKLQLAVDKDSVLRNKVVPKSWEGNITPIMQWVYNKEYVTKAELGMMAILVNNNWERPIYFANMLSADNFIGLEKYLVNEGLVYKLMPIEVEQAKDHISLVNEDTLYRNITAKYQWGNMANIKHFDTDYKTFVGPYLWDETVTLAMDVLSGKGDLVKAKHVADLAIANLPKKIVNTQQVHINSFVVDTLLKVEDEQKALQIASTSLDYLDQQFKYLQSMGNRLSGFDVRELHLAVDTLERYRNIASMNDNKKLMAWVRTLESKYARVE